MQMEYVSVFGEKQLVFGLRWLSMVGEKSSPQTKQLAKKEKANHWVVAGTTFTAIGLKKKRAAIKKELYSAAVCYALLYPKGVHAAIYKINETHYWLVGCQEGTPMSRADVLFNSPDEVSAALDLLKQQYMGLHVSASFDELTNFVALIATRSLQKAELYTLKRRLWPSAFLLSLCIALIVWWRLDLNQAEAASSEPEIDPYLSYWETQQIQPNGSDALRQLILFWERLPLQLAEWQLQDSSCEAKNTLWRCKHRYVTTTDTATALDLEARLPEGWTIQETSMQQVVLQSQNTYEVGQERWRTADEVRLGLLSQLQHIRPAFQALRLVEPTPLVPTITSHAQYVPIFTQALHFEGPLRSSALLLDVDNALHWSRATLTYRPQVIPSLKSSALQANLQGMVYVRH